MQHITAGTHVGLHCENHPDMTYNCKVIAVDKNGRYNGIRTLFGPHDNSKPECLCDGSALIIDDDARSILEKFYSQ